MKRFLCLFLTFALILTASLPQIAFATEMPTDHTNGTQVTYTGNAVESYTVTVPAALDPGDSSTVTVTGTWNSTRVLTVTADENVTLTNSLNSDDTIVLGVDFAGIEAAGSDTDAVTAAETVSVANWNDEVTKPIFGVWSGRFHYNVELKSNDALELNEYGFYFNQPYQTTLDGVLYEFVFYEDGDASLWMTEEATIAYILTASCTYEKDTIIMNGSRFTLSEDGKTLSDDAMTMTVNSVAIGGLQYGVRYFNSFNGLSVIFREDGSLEVYGYDGSLAFDYPAGTVTAEEQFAAITFGTEQLICPIYPDGKKILIEGEGLFEFVCPHETTEIRDIDQTCVDEGMIAAEICEDCGEIVTAGQQIAPTGHTWNDDEICTTCGADMYPHFTVSSDNRSMIGYTGTENENLIIPALFFDETEQTWYKVTAIDADAFKDCTNLTSITIPDSVTSIGNSAFLRCTNLTSVTFGNRVTSIGKNAFSHCSSLTSITIPDSVISIRDAAFNYCTNLTSVTFGNSVTSIGSYAFDHTGLTSITIPDSVTSISNNAFSYCTSLTSITIENGVTSIGAWSFAGCTNLTSITIPDSVTSIGSYAFRECTSLTSVTIGKGVSHIDIGKRLFSYCSSLTSITVDSENTVYHSDGNCMIETASKTLVEGCNNSTIPSDGSVTSIGEYAFEGRTGLTSITIPDNVTSIGNYAFYDCTGLTSVVIPESVTSVGYSAFSGCSGLVSVTIGNGVTGIADNTFYKCNSLTSVTIGSGVTSITPSAFLYCSSLTTITVDSGNTVYHSDDNCVIQTASKELVVGCNNSTIPSDGSVTSIGSYAFHVRTGLTSITIPDNVTSIGGSAFYGCTGLTSIVIPESVTSIGANVFNGCSGLTSIVIPESVTSIGYYAFAGCSGLISVVIPESVTSVGDRAFSGCSGLISITFEGTIEQWNAITFGNYWNSNVPATEIICSDGTVSLG